MVTLGLVGCDSGGISASDQVGTRQAFVAPTSTLPIQNITIQTGKTPQANRGMSLREAFLKGEPCAPPCWEGITPKKTTLLEALEIMNQHPFITKIEPSDNDRLYFALTFGNREFGGFLAYHQEPPYTIQEIKLNLPSLKLGEVILTYGEPSYILLNTGSGLMPEDPTIAPRLYWFGVVYPENGFVMSIRDFLPPDYSITDRQELNDVTFFGTPFELPLDDRMKHIFGTNTGSYELIPWQDYQSFAFYCSQVPKNEDLYISNGCPDYVLTLTPHPKNP
jgi:hypothetical protein